MSSAVLPLTAPELQRTIMAQRGGGALLLYRTPDGELQVAELAGRVRMTIGRGPDNDLSLYWDGRISRTHAELEQLGRDWVVSDDGLSRNGTELNGERTRGRHRLLDGDVITMGDSAVLFRGGLAPELAETAVGEPGVAQGIVLTTAQERVLRALVAPIMAGRPTAATNHEIAEALVLSLDAVKTHLRAISLKFGLAGVPQNEKRARLAEAALRRGIARS